MSRRFRCFLCLLAAYFGTILLMVAARLIMRNDAEFESEPFSFTQNGAESAQSVLDRGFSTPFLSDNQIFFVETSCAAQTFSILGGRDVGRLELDATQACAIESAARANPSKRVILFYSCPLEPASLARSSELVRSVFSLPNVFVWHQSMRGLFAGTPLEELQRSGAMDWSLYPKTHASDVLRMLILWKFGGFYLDLDFIVLKSLNDLADNFASFEASGVGLTCAALRFSTSGVGRDVAELAVNDLKTNFSGLAWAWNGPDLVERILRRLCNEQRLDQLTPDRCSNFVVYPAKVFYPFEGFDWDKVYEEAESGYIMDKIRTAGSHTVHLWGSKKRDSRRDLDVRKNSNQTLSLLMRNHCPSTHELS